MKKVFTTTMPEKTGAFLKAAQILKRLEINISRVSYNKVIDSTMLFIEASGKEENLKKAEEIFKNMGYVKDGLQGKSVELFEFKLSDKPGALLPVLFIIKEFDFNISYINSYSDGLGFQNIKLGLLIPHKEKTDEFLKRVAKICPVKVLDYKKYEKSLDNTVFYVSFVNELSLKNHFSEKEKQALLINSNLIMQLLEKKDASPWQVFSYIGKFSELLNKYKGNSYIPEITEYKEHSLIVVEPPCGSNICVFDCEDMLLFIDSGFNCYKTELFDLLKEKIPHFNEKKREILITHSDVDHIGFLDEFSKVYLSENTAINLINVCNGKKGYREEIPSHEPYVRISKLLSGFEYPKCNNFHIIGSKRDNELLSFIGKIDFKNLSFEAYEGCGGHVKGETVYIERKKRIVFTGDLYVNINGCIPAQSEFNKIAPYLLSSVDSKGDIAYKIRREIKPLLDKGEWLVIGGHGAPKYWYV